MADLILTYGYDRHQRCWCILIQDEDRNTTHCEYCGDKKWCQNSIDLYKKEFGITKVIKYKAY